MSENLTPIALTAEEWLLAMMRCRRAWLDYHLRLLHARFPEMIGPYSDCPCEYSVTNNKEGK